MPLPAQIPDYLLKNRIDGIAARSVQGMGSALPPRISIRGNQFTLIDATGAQLPVGATLDMIVVDVSDHMNKRYYDSDWGPNSDSPPDCWSANGIGPSRESPTPQATTCDQCQWNVRGSDTSKLSGKAIKACRDEKWMAVIPSSNTGMVFRMVLTPGSFKNWGAFIKQFENAQIDVVDVIVRVGFQPQQNGVMTFDIAGYIPEQFVAVRNQAKLEKADLLVGRLDQPIGALPTPAAQPTSTALPAPSFGAAVAGPTQQPTTAAPAAATDPAAEPARRTRAPRQQKAEPAQAPFPVSPPAQPTGFGVAATEQPAFGQGNGQAPGTSFGIGAGAAPDPQLAAMLKGLRPNG